MYYIENLLKEHLDCYTDRCLAIFERYIGIYKNIKNDDSKQIEGICEAFDNFELSLTFLSFPDLGNYGPVLNDKDHHFMHEPDFLDEEYESELLSTIEKHFTSNNIDKDEYDEYQIIALKLVPNWLSKCWIQANKSQSTNYSLYYFVHRYFNEPALNLLNQQKVFLDQLHK